MWTSKRKYMIFIYATYRVLQTSWAGYTSSDVIDYFENKIKSYYFYCGVFLAGSHNFVFL